MLSLFAEFILVAFQIANLQILPSSKMIGTSLPRPYRFCMSTLLKRTVLFD